MDPERARRLAESALAASTADETEVVVELREHEVNRFTADHPVQNQFRNLAEISVRVRVDGREGKASTGTVTEEAIRKTVARAVEVAGHMPKPTADVLPMAGEQEYDLRRPDPLTADPVATAESVGAMTATAREQGCQAAGIQSTDNELRLVMNSRGLHVWDADTRAEVSLSVFKDDGAGWAYGIGPDADSVSSVTVAERAVDKALRSRNAKAVDPGHYTVILEPAAVASLLLFASYKGFGAQQVRDGSSFLAGHMGEQVFGENVSIADDAFHPLAIGHRFDGEGMPRTRVDLIDHGVARGMVHDRRTAAQNGCRSTGHAIPQPNSFGPLSSNLVFASGDAGAEQLVRDVDHGILVTEFHYTNMVEPTKLTLTGMTRNGTFLVENGEVTGPIKNLRFTQSLVEAMNQVSGIGDDATLASALFGGFTVVPTVRIDGFRFSSVTEF